MGEVTLMTLDEFFVELQKVKEDGAVFKFVSGNSDYSIGINYQNYYCCPITAVFLIKRDKFISCTKYREAGKELGMDRDDVRRIVDSNDATLSDFYSPELRAKLVSLVDK